MNKSQLKIFGDAIFIHIRFGMILIAMFFLPNVFAGQIALTFDDAPFADSAVMGGEERAQRIAHTLTHAKIPDALFFVRTGGINETGSKILQRYERAGFHLANHSHSHWSANKTAPIDFMTDVYRAHLILAQRNTVLPYFRFPYLHYGQDKKNISELQTHLTALGYGNGYVTVDNYDWYLNALLNRAVEDGKNIDMEEFERLYVEVIWDSIAFYDALALRVLDRSPRHVLLLHENDTTALFLAALIKRIRVEGWQIIAPQQAYQDPIAASLPNTLFHKQGRVAALAAAQGVPLEQLRQSSENQEYLDQLVARKAVFTDPEVP